VVINIDLSHIFKIIGHCHSEKASLRPIMSKKKSCFQRNWGFAPIGMLECWNSGIMGSGIMQCWINGKIHINDKIKMANILLKTNIPSFHHSIIPFPGKIRKPQKLVYSQQFVEIPRR
jgi:hypothetical protein